VPADSALQGKDFVCLYFSAHWCPPCRMFTPKLKDFYNEVKSKNVEIVFVSGDRSPKDMMDYMKESHGDWLAVEHDSTFSNQLDEKFDVSGIPTLVVLRGDGTVVTKGGRGDVGSHGAAALEFWNKSALDMLKGKQLQKANGTQVSADSLLSTKKLLGFYFSAHWCPPCRAFTPKLKEFYDKTKNEGLEIIFISADENKKAMEDYMKESHGDWLAVEHGSDLSKELPLKFGVEGIPTFVILKADGTQITDDGTSAVMEKGSEAIKDWLK